MFQTNVAWPGASAYAWRSVAGVSVNESLRFDAASTMSLVNRYSRPTMLNTATACGGPFRMAWACLTKAVFLSSALASNMLALHGIIARSAHISSARLVSVCEPGPSAITYSASLASDGNSSRTSSAFENRRSDLGRSPLIPNAWTWIRAC